MKEVSTPATTSHGSHHGSHHGTNSSFPAAEYCSESPFVCRPYLKTELAQLYAPRSTPATALQQLYRWIRQHPQLWPELQAQGSPRHRHTFMRREVALIIHYLGEP